MITPPVDAADAAGASFGSADRAELQRRTLRVLSAGQVIGAAALASAVTVGAFVIQGILGQDTPWAGVATAMVTTGTGFMAQMLSRLMQRRGRRAGLQLGYGLAVIGGLLGAGGAEFESLPLFLCGLFLYGNGQAANLLARYAATDLAEPAGRSQAMSRIVFASTFGAVLGPLLIGPAEHVGQAWFGLEKYTGPWLFGSTFFTVAMINTSLRLRPDPLIVAGGLSVRAPEGPPIRITTTIASIIGRPAARLAVLAMIISQVTMVAVMAMTPVHLKLHNHEGVSQYVVSVHIAGMYAFSPLVGRYCDRRGRVPAIFLGAVLLVVSTLLAAVSGGVEQLLFPSLWILGLGWNFGLIGGSNLLIDSVSTSERVAVQGAADLMMSLSGGLAGFASGFIRRAVGFHLLAAFSTAAAAVLLVVAYFARRTPVGHDPVAAAEIAAT
ncbi:MAG: MFS transporter, partial [Ilumatobacteraceae bacterium]